MAKIDMRTALAEIRADVERDSSATDNALKPLYVLLRDTDGLIAEKQTVERVTAAIKAYVTEHLNDYITS